jgi:hypothetical protein
LQLLAGPVAGSAMQTVPTVLTVLTALLLHNLQQ